MKQTPKARKQFQRTAMIALAVTPRLKDRIDIFAERENVSRSQAVRMLVESGLVTDQAAA